VRRPMFASLFISILVSLTTVSAPAQELYDFNSLAAEVSQAIEKSSSGSGRTVVLVTDFYEPHNPDSQLALALTQDFAKALRDHARNPAVLDRTDVQLAISNHKMPEGALSGPGLTACYASELAVTRFIRGWIEYTPGKMILTLDAPVEQGKGEFIIDLTPAMEALMSKPAPKTAAFFGEDETVWAKDEESRMKTPPASAGKQGYSYPSCVYCPAAQYSDSAVKAMAGGTVVRKVVIGADGKAKKISVERALPCGLDLQAISAVKDWEFKPAAGPDGKPAAVLQRVEVTFHTY
jgi:TonB family protein